VHTRRHPLFNNRFDKEQLDTLYEACGIRIYRHWNKINAIFFGKQLEISHSDCLENQNENQTENENKNENKNESDSESDSFPGPNNSAQRPPLGNTVTTLRNLNENNDGSCYVEMQTIEQNESKMSSLPQSVQTPPRTQRRTRHSIDNSTTIQHIDTNSHVKGTRTKHKSNNSRSVNIEAGHASEIENLMDASHDSHHSSSHDSSSNDSNENENENEIENEIDVNSPSIELSVLEGPVYGSDPVFDALVNSPEIVEFRQNRKRRQIENEHGCACEWVCRHVRGGTEMGRMAIYDTTVETWDWYVVYCFCIFSI